jgi:hypothetical protein
LRAAPWWSPDEGASKAPGHALKRGEKPHAIEH